MRRIPFATILKSVFLFGLFLLHPYLTTAHQGSHMTSQPRREKKILDYRGVAFIAMKNLNRFESVKDDSTGFTILLSKTIDSPIPFNEAVLSWNVDAPPGTGIETEIQVQIGESKSRWYNMGRWSQDALLFPRESVKGQKDEDGNVETDTLVLKIPAKNFQLRLTLKPDSAGTLPNIKFLGVSLIETKAVDDPLAPLKSVWGKEIVVPGKSQSGYPDSKGWCSPTSADMILSFWSKRLNRPELDMPVPDAAHAVFDKAYDGTGNWSFNMAYAGSFTNIRAYVARFSDIRELESWVEKGLPVVVSVSYDLLKGKTIDNDPGHLMVCDGFTESGDIVLNDPAHHPEKGEACRKIFPRANFLKGWKRSRNTVYLIYAEGTKLPRNIYGHWE